MGKKLTKDEFIEKAKKVHGGKYDYSKVEYINNSTKVCIICPKHGEFLQTPNDHLDGCGCKECGKEKRKEKKLHNTDIFIERAKQIHGDKYNYSKVEYVHNKKKVCIICPIHGEFWQIANDHLGGHGCRKCTSTHKNSTDEFIEKAKKVHGDKYDYSKVEYNGAFKKVRIICPKHGEFLQKASVHLQGCGCKECMLEKRTRTTLEFIEEAKKVHGDKYDYSKAEYINGDKKVCIICPKHGEFWQIPYAHIKMKQGCPNCFASLLETEVDSYLCNNNIEHIWKCDNFHLKWLKRKHLDFYLPKQMVAIECQGIQHFVPVKYFGGKERYVSNIERDKLKKQLCDEHGIELIYFTHEKVEEPYLGKVFTNINDLIEYINSKKE